MPVVLVTMKLLNGFFRKAKATPCCITESETESKILIRRYFSKSSKPKYRSIPEPLPAFDKVHMHSCKGICNRRNDLLELVVINLHE